MLVARNLRPLAASLLLYVALAAGCSSNEAVTQHPQVSPTPLPTPACNRYTPDSTRQIVAAFLVAYNAGAPDITDEFIAPVGEFQWYGAPGREFPDDPASTERSTLPNYFAAQHAKGDRLELKSFSYSGVTYSADIHAGAENFGYTLTHSVANGPTHDAPGKGAISCQSGKIAVWLISSW